jgi:ankyrin repeat protein
VAAHTNSIRNALCYGETRDIQVPASLGMCPETLLPGPTATDDIDYDLPAVSSGPSEAHLKSNAHTVKAWIDDLEQNFNSEFRFSLRPFLKSELSPVEIHQISKEHADCQEITGREFSGADEDYIEVCHRHEFELAKQRSIEKAMQKIASPADQVKEFRFAARTGQGIAVRRLLQDYDIDVNSRNEAGLTALHSAAWAGSVGVVEVLLESGANPNLGDPNGCTALHVAAHRGDVLTIEALINAGANKELADSRGWRPLHEATDQRRVQATKMLLQYRADGDAANSCGSTPLHLAIRSTINTADAIEVAMILILHGVSLHARTSDWDTALFLAAERDHAMLVRVLVEKGADVNVANKVGKTALHGASAWGYKEVVSYLLRSNANVYAEDYKGQTALHYAARGGIVAIIELLVNAGLSVDCKDYESETPLFTAAANGHLDAARYLVKRGANRRLQDRHGRTPFLAAILNGRVHVVRFLLDQGSSVLETDRIGNSALHFAAMNNHVRMVELLLKWHSNFDLTSRGYRPIDCVLRNPINEKPTDFDGASIIKLLAEAGADVNYEAACVLPKTTSNLNFGVANVLPPLHQAVLYEQISSAEELLRWRARIDDKALGRYSALHLSVAAGTLKSTRLLIRHGAVWDAELTAWVLQRLSKYRIVKGDSHSDGLLRRCLRHHSRNRGLMHSNTSPCLDLVKILTEEYEAGHKACDFTPWLIGATTLGYKSVVTFLLQNHDNLFKASVLDAAVGVAERNNHAAIAQDLRGALWRYHQEYVLSRLCRVQVPVGCVVQFLGLTLLAAASNLMPSADLTIAESIDGSIHEIVGRMYQP